MIDTEYTHACVYTGITGTLLPASSCLVRCTVYTAAVLAVTAEFDHKLKKRFDDQRWFGYTPSFASRICCVIFTNLNIRGGGGSPSSPMHKQLDNCFSMFFATFFAPLN